MKLKHISISNFKTFDKLELDLNQLNIIIGANASGKSNFIQALKFLRDLVHYGLRNAISMQGGAEYITNSTIKYSEAFSLSVIADLESTLILDSATDEKIIVNSEEIDYDLSIEFNTRGNIKNISEMIKLKIELMGRFNPLSANNEEFYLDKKAQKGFITLTRSNEDININYNLGGTETKAPLLIEKFPKVLANKVKLPRDKTVLESTEAYILGIPPIKTFASDIAFFDIDPKLSKNAVSMTGKNELEEDGSNLPMVLHTVFQSRAKKKKLMEITKDVLPFIKDLDVDNIAGKYLSVKMCEVFNKKYLPAPLISDGTINITSLIIALYFTKNNVIILEEPERNTHPQLISRIVSMAKEASEKKQIFITTHNPEFVKYVDFEKLLLVERNEKGFTQIVKPAEKEEVKTFVSNNIGVDELYVSGFL